MAASQFEPRGHLWLNKPGSQPSAEGKGCLFPIPISRECSWIGNLILSRASNYFKAQVAKRF